MSDATSEGKSEYSDDNLPPWAVWAGIGGAILFFVIMAVSGGGDSEVANAETQVASAPAPADSVPSVCKGTSVTSVFGFFRTPDAPYPAASLADPSRASQAILTLVNNGNYTIQNLTTRQGQSGPQCWAQLRISGTYYGTSYDQTLWTTTYARTQ